MRSLLLALVLALSLSPCLQAATIVWNAASGTDTNWSDNANWVGGVAPTGADDVQFTELGTNTSIGVPNSLVDTSFGGYIGSLRIAQSNNYHTILITNGSTLNITNGSLVVASLIDINVARNLTNTITGVGATLNVSNPTGVIALNQGTAASVSGTRANLDLSGLDNFNANVSRLGLGTTFLPNPGNAAQREAGALFLAKTNNITLG